MQGLDMQTIQLMHPMRSWGTNDLGELPPELCGQPSSAGHGHSPVEGSFTDCETDADYLSILMDMEVGNDGQEGFPCPSSFCDVGAALSPNLESQGIPLQMPHSDTLTQDSHIYGISMRVGEPPALPEPRIRPHTAMPAFTHAPAGSPTGDIPVLSGRPQDIYRTQSCPSAANFGALPPMPFTPSGMPQHEALPQGLIINVGRSRPAERQRVRFVPEASVEELLVSPPKRRGKGGRQRAPPPDASMDAKKAKRILANRISAAKSKEKQKRKIENLQRESQEKANLLLRLREEVERRGRLRDAMRQKNYHLGGTLKELKEQDMDLAAVLEKLRDLRKVLFNQLDCSPTAPAGTSAMHYCPGQGEGYVSLHAYSTHMMPGAPPPFDMPLENGPLTPDMPDEELPVVSTAQMSESFSQMEEGNNTSSPSDVQPGCGHSSD